MLVDTGARDEGPTRPAPPTSSSTCSSRAPRSFPPARSRRLSMEWGRSPMPSPPRSRPVTGRGWWTTTWEWGCGFCPRCCSGAFRQKEIDSERQVVFEEINMHEDDPQDSVFEAFSRTVHDGHALGTPGVGHAGVDRGDDPRQPGRLLASPLRSPLGGGGAGRRRPALRGPRAHRGAVRGVVGRGGRPRFLPQRALRVGGVGGAGYRTGPSGAGRGGNGSDRRAAVGVRDTQPGAGRGYVLRSSRAFGKSGDWPIPSSASTAPMRIRATGVSMWGPPPGKPPR